MVSAPASQLPSATAGTAVGEQSLAIQASTSSRAALGSGLTLLLADHCPLLLLPVRDVSPQGSPSDLRLPGLWL